VPIVDVLAEDPTPTPTSTPFPTPTPTPRPPVPIYLPIAVKQKCQDLEFRADVVLAIDTSGSMEDPSREGGVTKIDAAVAAARDFVNRLELPDDQASLVTFDSEARLDQELTGDRQKLLEALDRVETATGTRIDLGLEKSLEELTSERARLDQNRVIILLTDGRSSVPNEQVLEMASRCKDERILIFTIGLGTAEDVDYQLLREVASDSDYFYVAPTTDDLERIYREIAFTLECVNLNWP
jgi:Mg-chelatase subunit ChlD